MFKIFFIFEILLLFFFDGILSSNISFCFSTFTSLHKHITHTQIHYTLWLSSFLLSTFWSSSSSLAFVFVGLDSFLLHPAVSLIGWFFGIFSLPVIFWLVFHLWLSYWQRFFYLINIVLALINFRFSFPSVYDNNCVTYRYHEYLKQILRSKTGQKQINGQPCP